MQKIQKSLVIGCIGCGNMGGALLTGLARHGGYTLLGWNRTAERIARLEGVRPVADMRTLAHAADVILVALKPHLVADTLEQIRPELTRNKLVISVAAGITQAVLQAGVGGLCPVVRAMPNTSALVGKGVCALCLEDPLLTPERKEDVLALFRCAGMALELPESKFPAFTALLGAGPAYVFHCMHALMQAGITLGFPRADARRMVDMLFEGCAVMAEGSASSHADLRDQVCSPGGLTIAGVNHLERTAVTGHLIDAVLAADAKGRAMEK